jgi:hypothetical protein
MSSPQIPATTISAKAMARAFTGGNAVGPRSGNFGMGSCGTGES